MLGVSLWIALRFNRTDFRILNVNLLLTHAQNERYLDRKMTDRWIDDR